MKPHRQRDALSDRITAYIGLGSNLDGPSGQIQHAFMEMGALSHTSILARSHLYKSRPLGPQNQPDYINAVAKLATELEPLVLLQALRKLEEAHGRQRTDEGRWGARSLDLDILVYGDICLDTPELTLPHPGIHLRSFVLYPLAELAPTLVISGHGTVQALRDRCHTPAIERYEEAANE